MWVYPAFTIVKQTNDYRGEESTYGFYVKHFVVFVFVVFLRKVVAILCSSYHEILKITFFFGKFPACFYFLIQVDESEKPVKVRKIPSFAL